MDGLPFSELLQDLPPQNVFLLQHPDPALVFEPIDAQLADVKVDTGLIKVPDLSTGPTSVVDPGRAADIHAQIGSLIDTGSRVVWLTKTDRNPFSGFLTLGRARNNDVVLSNRTVSKVHLLVHRAGDGWLVEDNGSTNGTLLDGVKLVPKVRAQISDQSGLAIGLDLRGRFFLPETLWAFSRVALGANPADLI